MVISIFGDESSDESHERVFSVSGLIGKGARVAAFVSCIPLMQPGCQGNCSLRCGRQNGHAPSTSNRPPTTMNTRVTEKPARKCGRV